MYADQKAPLKSYVPESCGMYDLFIYFDFNS